MNITNTPIENNKKLIGSIYLNKIICDDFVFHYYLPMIKGWFGFKTLPTITNPEFHGYTDIRSAVEELIRFATNDNKLLTIENYSKGMDLNVKFENYVCDINSKKHCNLKTEYESDIKSISDKELLIEVYNSHNKVLQDYNFETFVNKNSNINKLSYENIVLGYEIDHQTYFSN